MRITTIGRGNIGGGLGELWRQAGHEVVELGKEGGDCAGSDAVLLAVPQGAIPDALGSVSGLEAIPVESGVDAADVLRHDETDPVLALMLATMEPPELPVAIGVIYDCPAPTLEGRLRAQAPTTGAPISLNALLRQGPTWRMPG